MGRIILQLFKQIKIDLKLKQNHVVYKLAETVESTNLPVMKK